MFVDRMNIEFEGGHPEILQSIYFKEWNSKKIRKVLLISTNLWSPANVLNLSNRKLIILRKNCESTCTVCGGSTENDGMLGRRREDNENADDAVGCDCYKT
ncbi:hypothetical protein NECAME_10079 [Necator americanus]|uniref:Uncharacterized protein n=1 Tax=Necator americanus TaxID=51031 RepID=W2TB87_NECAM|nr:hypothetical protein NECAME_10079 [Necator americanus]ETN78854.1 hypothetical protein NECAME_10079 [Necator americanus]